MKTISLFTLFCLTSYPLHAGSVQIAQWIPWEFVTKEMKKLPLTLSERRDSMELEFGELKPLIKGFRFDVTGNLGQVNFTKDGIDAQSSNMNVEVSFDSLNLDQIIVREFNGNRLNVELKATCSPLKLSIEKFGVNIHSLFSKSGNTWVPDIQNIQFDIPQGSWNINHVTCQGIDGVSTEIERMLNETLKNPVQVEALLKTWVRDEINHSWPIVWSGLSQGLGEDVEIIGMEKPRDKGLITLGLIHVSTQRTELLSPIDDTLLGNTSPQLVLSNEGLNAIVEDKFLQVAPKKYNLQTVQGFADLMKSRFKQQFVWPDLKRFNTSSPFYVTTFDNQSRFTIQQINNEWKAQLNANGVLQAEIGGALIDYINFGMTVESPLQISLKDSKLSVKSGKSSLGLSWDFGALYQMLFRPNKRIAVDILKSAINQLFMQKSIEQDLPVLEIDRRKWKLQNWQKKQELIIMDWVEEGV